MFSLYTECFPGQAAPHSFVEGFMGRFVSRIFLACIILSCFLLAACGHSSTTNVVAEAVPASVSLCLSPSTGCAAGLNVSLEAGQSQVFTATARNVLNAALNETFTFQSNNPAAVTIANNGTACAGTWDSVVSPLVCTPGPVGIAQITVSAQGVSSPPVTIYVHQHITSISISKAPVQPQPTLSTSCLSKRAPAGPESWLYQASAFNGGTDITSTVGPFSWQQVPPSGGTNIVTLTALPVGSPLNQETVTANTPGLGTIFASASGINSQPLQVETCRIQSIAISSISHPSNSFVVNTGSSATLNATVTDRIGMTLVGVPLTWYSSNPVSVTASGTTSTVYGSVGTVSTPSVGASAVIAACTPPTCNGGFKPSLPIYPESAASFIVKSSTAPTSPAVYATTTACLTANPNAAACNTTIVPITSSSGSNFSAGTPVTLPSSPNSILFDNGGTSAYLGVDTSNFGQRGLMTFSGSSASQSTNVFGKVLAVSPDKRLIVISDTADPSNQVFVYDTTNQSAAPFLIPKATTAAFSPDSLKAFIISRQACPGTSSAGCLFVYSKLDALQKIQLGVLANDVTVFPQGAFVYLAGGAASSVLGLHTCDNSPASTVSVATIPELIRALPDAATLVALEPPLIQLINVVPPSVPPSSPAPWQGCAPPVNDTVTGTFNLGQGNFTATQFIISSDGSAAYILGETQPGVGLPVVMVFNILNQTSSVFSLANGATPLSASLSPAGDLLFVGATDGAVHVVNTTSGLDQQQITFPFPQNALCFGPGTPATLVPVTLTSISATSQSGSNTTYTYTLTSGAALQPGKTIVVTGMSDPGNNGTFAISTVGSGTFTVANAAGVTATAQSAIGTVPITCNPDLVAVKP